MAKQKITNKHIQILIVTLLVLTSIFFSIYFRSYSATLPIADQWAENSIKSNLRNQVTSSINQQYPNLPADRKTPMIEAQIEQVLADEKDAFNEQKEQQAKYIRERLQKDDGQTYLLAIDPYHYLRNVENVAATGTVCDDIKEGECWDTYSRAPVGKKASEEYHTKLSATVYNIVKIFNKNAQPFNVFFWIPVLISALAVIPAFFLTRKKAGNLGGFIAAMIIAVHSTFLGRTAAGFSDTDAYNITFPLLIFWLFIEAFEAKEIKKKLLFAGLTGLTLGIYSRFWTGWWYLFVFMLLTIITYLMYTIIKTWAQEGNLVKGLRTKETKDTSIIIGSILLSSTIFVSIFSSFARFIQAPLSTINALGIQDAAHANLWPNVYTTVAELNRASLASIVNQLGGASYFYLACLGLVITLISVKEFKGKDWILIGGGAFVYLLLITQPLLTGNPYVYLALLLLPVAYGLISLLKDKRNIDIKYALFLIIWFVGTIYASTQGIRFILLIIPAYAVALGIIIGQLYKLISKWAQKQWDIEQIWIKGTLIILALLILISPIRAAHQTALNEVPSMNDAWWDSLTKINEEAAPDAIINSWWDFGHWFKAVGNRSVTFDGASQNTPMAHWIGRALSTDNEQETIGILRMLDCGSKTGFDILAMSLQGTTTLNEITPETTLAAKTLMNEIILQERNDAKKTLQTAGLKNTEQILELTHCEAPENYLITSTDMIGKASVWGHFGEWDFKKAYIYNTLRDETPTEATPIIQELYDINEKDANALFYQVLGLATEQQANAWISPWPQYMTSSAASCSETNNTITCTINANLGQQQGQQIILEQTIVPLDKPQETTVIIAAYNPSTGQRLGANELQPKAIILPENNTLKKISLENPGLDYEVFIGEVNGQYKAVIASSELASSMFTRLFFFEGAYTNNFELFSKEQSPITGHKITIWKVKWDA